MPIRVISPSDYLADVPPPPQLDFSPITKMLFLQSEMKRKDAEAAALNEERAAMTVQRTASANRDRLADQVTEANLRAGNAAMTPEALAPTVDKETPEGAFLDSAPSGRAPTETGGPGTGPAMSEAEFARVDAPESGFLRTGTMESKVPGTSAGLIHLPLGGSVPLAPLKFREQAQAEAESAAADAEAQKKAGNAAWTQLTPEDEKAGYGKAGTSLATSTYNAKIKPEKETKPAKTIAFPDDKRLPDLVRGKTFTEGDPLFAFAEKVANNAADIVVPRPKAGTGTGAAGDAAVDVFPGMYGDDLRSKLKGTNTQDFANVQSMLDGRMDPAQLASMRKGRREYLVGLANRIDSNFDGGAVKARYSLRKDFASGKTANNVRSINTAIQHLGTLDTAVSELDPSGFPLINSARNYALTGIGSGRVKGVGTSMLAVATEMAAALKGGNAAPTQEEIKEQLKNFTEANSPEQWRAVINKSAELLSGRLRSLEEQWTDAFGAPPANPLIRPAARQVAVYHGFADRLGLGAAEGAAPARTGGRPAPGGTGGVPKLGDKRTWPNGKVGVWDGQGWMAQ